MSSAFRMNASPSKRVSLIIGSLPLRPWQPGARRHVVRAHRKRDGLTKGSSHFGRRGAGSRGQGGKDREAGGRGSDFGADRQVGLLPTAHAAVVGRCWSVGARALVL